MVGAIRKADSRVCRESSYATHKAHCDRLCGWRSCCEQSTKSVAVSSRVQRDKVHREVQMLAEWWRTLPRGWKNKTNVPVGAQELQYQGRVLSPARQRAFSVWHDKVDMRIFTGVSVWLVEGKIVNTGNAYGQLLDYADEYTASADYQQFSPAFVDKVVVCAFERKRTSSFYERFGIRTIVFTPSWAGETLASSIFSGAQI